mmetsp:Transcript_33500/g.51439  ORF Transcript_33500/g.51439 Transcript_33500/m.51439 type:complete len:178 (-) Transcript_33500:5615-6148(-)
MKRGVKNGSPIDGENLVWIMFDFIKRRQPFGDLIRELSSVEPKISLTPISLMTYLLTHSNNQLRALLFMSCSKFMPVPLCASNLWDADNEGVPRTLNFSENLLIFEKTKSLLQVKISESGSTPSGVSSFLNRAFGKSFKVHTGSLVDQGSIEIQYDFDCSQIEYVVVADHHGEADLD